MIHCLFACCKNKNESNKANVQSEISTKFYEHVSFNQMIDELGLYKIQTKSKIIGKGHFSSKNIQKENDVVKKMN